MPEPQDKQLIKVNSMDSLDRDDITPDDDDINDEDEYPDEDSGSTGTFGIRAKNGLKSSFKETLKNVTKASSKVILYLYFLNCYQVYYHY